MIIRKQFVFPRVEVEGVRAVEEKYLELRSRSRDGERLEPEEVDYMDFANTVLLTAA